MYPGRYAITERGKIEIFVSNLLFDNMAITMGNVFSSKFFLTLNQEFHLDSEGFSVFLPLF